MNDDDAEVHALSGAYVLDALSADERSAFERHLVTCSACREEVASFGPAVEALTAESERVAPATLRSSVLAAIDDVRPQPPRGAEPDRQLASRWSPRRAATWFALAAAVLGVALVGTAWRVSSLQGQVTSLSAAADSLQQVLTAADSSMTSATVASGGTATLIVARSKDKAALVTNGVPAAPSGHAYQAWWIDAEGNATSAGMMPEDGMLVLGGDPTTAAAVGLSVEPSGGSVQPTTTPIVALALPA